MRSPLLSWPSAVEADPPDAGVALHYGDPLGEQRRLTGGAGFVDLSHRGVVRVGGSDRLAWLHSLITQHVEALGAGESTQSLILSPHGHVEHHLSVVDDGAATWFHVEPGTAGDLVRFLDSMRFLMRVDVADVSDEWAVVWEPASGTHDPYLTRAHRGGPSGRELFVPRGQLEDFAKNEASAAPAGIWAYEALRVAAHEPRLGFETDHRTIPHEVGWIGSAVHLDKGCYRGQETVARVHNLGRPPRRLVFLHLDGSVETLPARGAPVEHEGRTVGHVTSSARHHELGPIALAVIKRNVPVEAHLVAGGVAAAQDIVVASDASVGRRSTPGPVRRRL